MDGSYSGIGPAWSELMEPILVSGHPNSEGAKAVKKLKTRLSVRKKLQKKREERALRTKAKQAHRRGTGFKDLEEAE